LREAVINDALMLSNGGSGSWHGHSALANEHITSIGLY